MELQKNKKTKHKRTGRILLYPNIVDLERGQF